MRKITRFKLDDPQGFKQKLLYWSKRENHCIWLDSNAYESEYSNFSSALALGAMTVFSSENGKTLSDFDKFSKGINDWLFGYFSYDLKNDIEDLRSDNFDGLNFPEIHFFCPEKLFFFTANTLETHYHSSCEITAEEDFNEIMKIDDFQDLPSKNVRIKLRIHKDEYFDKLDKILGHIQRGDIYEMNFCQEFYAEGTEIDPLSTYLKLNAISNPPFATFMKLNKKYLLSASPERYIQKKGSELISQPIKGTAKRHEDPEKDLLLKQNLEIDTKERSENIMIVDLVRNDLARVAKRGSVKVEELCKVYTFDQVHQMISTIRAEIPSDVSLVDILRASFPMGSMTGAPKISAMNLIEKYEETKRGLYSGAVGYISPDEDFDFNVVIRSILYNAEKQYVSYSVGGAITSKSDPLAEYEECLIKAKAMRTVLENQF